MRGWLRRFAGLAGRIREVFTGVAAAVSADPAPLASAGSAIADAVVVERPRNDETADHMPSTTACSQ